MRQRLIQTTLILTLGMAVSASAAPVLLGSFDAFTNGGHAPQLDPRLEFILQLSSPNGDIELGKGRDISWMDGDLGLAYFGASNDSAFEPFAAHATDGIEDPIILWSLFPSGGGDGNPGTESQLFGRMPDLMGNSLDYVKLTVFDVQVEPWVPDPITFPDIHGYKFEAFLRYEFFGTPIPEPTVVAMLFWGLVFTRSFAPETNSERGDVRTPS